MASLRPLLASVARAQRLREPQPVDGASVRDSSISALAYYEFLGLVVDQKTNEVRAHIMAALLTSQLMRIELSV